MMSKAIIVAMLVAGTPAQLAITNPCTLATISEEGEVRIDWACVDESLLKSSRTQLAYARLIIAVRDGTWKPLR